MAWPYLATWGWFVAAWVLLLRGAAHPESPAEDPKADTLWVYVGTYTGGPSKGIYRFNLDPATGTLTNRALAAETTNPSFLAIHPNHRFLYAVGEIDNFNGQKTGAVSAFAIDPATGDLKLLNQQSSGGAGPCHLIVDKQGKHVLAANYGGGSACVLPIQADGRLGNATAVVQHKGSSVNKQRQERPHAHSINLDAANRFAFVADLGLDNVLIYRFDAARGTLTPNDPPWVNLAPGAGPRHFAFHPSGRFAYVINELASTVTALSYDADKGTLKELQTVTTLPKDFKGNSWTAEVVVHPSGKFLYGSNRGQDSIAIFAIDPETGKLTPVGHQTHQIKIPRNFNVDPTGRLLLVANQDGNNIVVFRIDQKTGELTPTETVVEVPKPVCVRMMPRPR
jgi:6-phosphogluconolactonase